MGLKFSVETQYSPTPWGVHQPWTGILEPKWTALVKSCPEIKINLPKRYRTHRFGVCPWGMKC